MIVSDQLFKQLVTQQIKQKASSLPTGTTLSSNQNIKLADDQFVQSSVFKNVSTLFNFSEMSKTVDKQSLELIFKDGMSNPISSSLLDSLNIADPKVKDEFVKAQNRIVDLILSKLKPELTSELTKQLPQKNSSTVANAKPGNSTSVAIAKLANSAQLPVQKNIEKIATSANTKVDTSSKLKAELSVELTKLAINSTTSMSSSQMSVTSQSSVSSSVNVSKIVDDNFPAIINKIVEVSTKLLQGNLKHVGSSIAGEVFMDTKSDSPLFISKPIAEVIEKLVLKQPISSDIANVDMSSALLTIVNVISSNSSMLEGDNKDIFSSLFKIFKKNSSASTITSSFKTQMNNIVSSNSMPSNIFSSVAKPADNLFTGAGFKNEMMNLLQESSKVSSVLQEENFEVPLKQMVELSKDMMVMNNLENKNLLFPFIFGDINGLFIQDNSDENSQSNEDDKEYFALALETTNLGVINVSFNKSNSIGIEFVSDNANTRMMIRKEKKELFENLTKIIDAPITIGVQ